MESLPEHLLYWTVPLYMDSAGILENAPDKCTSKLRISFDTSEQLQ